MEKRISQCMICVYDEDCKKNLEKFLKDNDDLVRWAYIENQYIKFLPPLHLYLDFGKRKFKSKIIEKTLKEYKLERSFIDMVLRGDWDIQSIFDCAGYSTLPIVSNVDINKIRSSQR